MERLKTQTGKQEEAEMRRGPWVEQEDQALIAAISVLGERRWDSLAKTFGLRRSGKSCRLRWLNYLRPNLKHGHITQQEENLIFKLHKQWGNRWARIARSLPGRTDNEIKNYWRCHLRKKAFHLQQQQEQQEGTLIGRVDGQDFSASSCSDTGDYYNSDRKDDDLSPCADLSSGNHVELDELSSLGFTYSPYETRLLDWSSWSNSCSNMENSGDDLYYHPGWISNAGGLNDTCLWDPTFSIWDMD